MTVLDALFTRADYDQLPEGFPAELVEGCLVKERAPTFDHGRAGSRLVDPSARTIEIRREGSAGRVFAGAEEARSRAVPGLVVTSQDLFADATR